MGVFCIAQPYDVLACDPKINWCNMTRKFEPDNNELGVENNQRIRLPMVFIKGLILFLIINLLFTVFVPSDFGNLSLYNYIFPGRLRLPFGENPEIAYNFSLNNLDAMISSHLISGDNKKNDEFRIVLIGDSSTWGILLKPEETLAGLLNNYELDCNYHKVQVYNLGYPTLSLTKDIMILEKSMKFEPDLIIWLVTLEAFPLDNQLTSPLVAGNLNLISRISEKYNMETRVLDHEERTSNLFDKSIIGQRRELADLLRLQLLGGMWAATSIDQVYPSIFDHAQVDLKNDTTFHNWEPPELDGENLAFEILDVGRKIAGDVPILLVNEPILVSNGENSNIRYNFYYPRWAFDQYRKLLADYSLVHSWVYSDLWDIVPLEEFTNSAIHLTPGGEAILADRIIHELRTKICIQ
jgi:hypothetical protein